MVTLVGVITLDVLPALLIGIGFSILLLVYRASRPTFSILGADPAVPGAYEDVERHSNVRQIPGVLIVRQDAELFYANAQLLRDTVAEMVDASGAQVRTLILDLDSNDELDITSSEALEKLVDDLAAPGASRSCPRPRDRGRHDEAIRRSGKDRRGGRVPESRFCRRIGQGLYRRLNSSGEPWATGRDMAGRSERGIERSPFQTGKGGV